MSAIPHVIAKCEGPEREVFLQKDGEDCFSVSQGALNYLKVVISGVLVELVIGC